MQTSILWEGSLPSKEEMEKMKQEGYLFRAVEGGWKICLKLHNTLREHGMQITSQNHF